jgi:hypothetical protein
LTAEDDLLAFWRRQFKGQGRATVVIIELAALFTLHGSQRLARLQYNMIRELAERRQGRFFTLAKGDLAVAVDRKDRANVLSQLQESVLRDAQLPDETIRRRVITFDLPEQIGELRDAIARYATTALEARAAALLPEFGAGGGAPLKGPLAPGMLERVEYQIMRSDIRPFVQRQTIFARPQSDKEQWTPRIQERRIALAKLSKDLFPELEIARTNPLFGHFCRILDERMLHHIIMGQSKIERRVSLNVSLATTFDRIFDTFLAHVPEANRENLLIEIDCADLFQDISSAVMAFARLRRQGLGIIIDGVSLETLPFVRLDKLDHDYLKILLPRDRVGLMSSDSRIKAMRKLRPDRVILGQCDNPLALKIGETLGIDLYQGWLLDQYEDAAAS